MPFTFTMPKLSPTMEEGTIASWHKKEGEYVEAGDLLLEITTDKATVEHNALDAGWLRKILKREGDSALVNQPIAVFTESEKELLEDYRPEAVVVNKAPTTSKQEEIKERKKEEKATTAPVSPFARKVAKEQGIDLSTIQGSGTAGRIVGRDLEHAAPGVISSEAPTSGFSEEALTPMRNAIAKRLQESKRTIPHFYVTKEIDAEPLVTLREQLIQGEVKVSINDLLIKACALALKQHPEVNSGFNETNRTIIRYHSVDISVGVSIQGGLITPIIHSADQKPVKQISDQVRKLASRAKEGKLEPQEYEGGSFTISNMGMYGVLDFQAIINPPQAAILAVSSIVEKPVVHKGQIVVGKVMNLTLSADHRVIDGVVAAQFLNTLQKLIGNPALLLL